MDSIWFKRAAALGLLSCLSWTAHAQYVWLNEQGVRQYSDIPPPASVPKNRILKSPANPAVSTAPATSTISPAVKNQAPMTIAERNAEFQKRRMEQAEKEKKAEEEERIAAAQARNCAHARRYQQSLQAGERIAHRAGNGERIALNDEQRARELREAQTILADCK